VFLDWTDLFNLVGYLGVRAEHGRFPITLKRLARVKPGNTKSGNYHCTVDLLFDWFGISCMTTDNFFIC
jgi:hypothetical protein